MKLELDRSELEQAIKCYLTRKGMDIENSDISIVVSKNTTIITLDERTKIESNSDIKEESNTFIGE
jgi:hypothetical protein